MMRAELTAEMIQALLALCDGVPLRGPESKILVARAQAALIEALRGDQGQPAGPPGGPQCLGADRDPPVLGGG